MNAETLTRKQIEALQTEAGSAADNAMVDICERALDGCPIALEAVRKAIDDAAAMDDETLPRMTDPYFIARVREDGSWDVIREIAAKDDDEANAIAERECEGDDWYVLTRRGGKLININGGVDG
jgi:hypothetical protein